MRTLKLALAAIAAFAFHANAQNAPVTGMGSPPSGTYQPPLPGTFMPNNQAFHAGGVAPCDGCHVMHNASGGIAKSTAATSAVAPWTNVTNMFLLQGSDQSSTCLICHAGVGAGTNTQQFTVYDSAASPGNRTPGGDFGWVRQSWGNSPGQRHGHNVAAADFGLTIDPDLEVAPGGAWMGGPGKKQFACSSCHDPHGRYRMQTTADPGAVRFVGPAANGLLPTDALPIAASGSYGDAPTADFAVGVYRLLGGQYYTPVSNASAPFPNDPPLAVAPAVYNASEAAAEVRVAYGTGMSEWCQNCHMNVHLDGYQSGVSGLRHPAGSDARFHAANIEIYNSYIASGRVDTLQTSRYTSLVPFEQGKGLTLAALRANATPAATIAADAQSNVMCLSCHRAHASAFDSIVRWDQNATFMTDNGAFTSGNTGVGGGAQRTPAQTRAGLYDRTVGTDPGQIGPYQRSLCNKCHAKD